MNYSINGIGTVGETSAQILTYLFAVHLKLTHCKSTILEQKNPKTFYHVKL